MQVGRLDPYSVCSHCKGHFRASPMHQEVRAQAFVLVVLYDVTVHALVIKESKSNDAREVLQ